MTKEEIKGTICNKCEYKDMRFHDRCMYSHGFHNEKCTYFRMSAYWRKKTREEENAKRLFELVEENGITPIYKIGDVVYIKGWRHSIEKTSIRLIEVDADGKGYLYKVKGHNEYTFKEEDVYPSEKECLKAVIEDFAKRTRRDAEYLIGRAEKIGLPMESIKFLENGKGNV